MLILWCCNFDWLKNSLHLYYELYSITDHNDIYIDILAFNLNRFNLGHPNYHNSIWKSFLMQFAQLNSLWLWTWTDSIWMKTLIKIQLLDPNF